MKALIISGFLGSGKTTLIKNLVDKSSFQGKIAIIENDFGDINTDEIILRNSNMTVTPINSGCICCNIAGDFKDSIMEIIENFSPDLFIVEPSGIARVSQVQSSFDSLKINHTTITTIDVTTAKKYYNNYCELFDDQVLNANFIYLTKIDIGDSSETKKLLIKIKPYSIVSDNLEDLLVNMNLFSTKTEENSCKCHEHEHNHEHTHCHEHEHNHEHTHCHEHEHNHKHAHCHEHEHNHKHADCHEHEHNHEHTHCHEHEHNHEHTHCHEHEHHEHMHCHEHNHNASSCCCNHDHSEDIYGSFEFLTIENFSLTLEQAIDFCKKICEDPNIIRIKGIIEKKYLLEYDGNSIFTKELEFTKNYLTVIGNNLKKNRIENIYNEFK